MWRCRLHCLFTYHQVHPLGGSVRQQPLTLHVVVVIRRATTPYSPFHHKYKFTWVFLFIEISSSLWKMVAAKPPFRCHYLGLPVLAECPRYHNLMRTELPAISFSLKFHSLFKEQIKYYFHLKHPCFTREVLLFCVLRGFFIKIQQLFKMFCFII